VALNGKQGRAREDKRRTGAILVPGVAGYSCTRAHGRKCCGMLGVNKNSHKSDSAPLAGSDYRRRALRGCRPVVLYGIAKSGLEALAARETPAEQP
jgi:hypothetical protein